MAGLEPAARPSRLAEVVARELEAWMRGGGLEAGAQLPSEKVLGERFGVSRSVIREAVSRLKADGWVETRQGAGAFVAPPAGRGSFRLIQGGTGAAETLAHIFELRHLVETGAADLAARRRGPADLARMAAALARMEAALAGTDAEEVAGAQADDEFHVAIAAATGNPMIHRFVEFMGQQFSDSRAPTWDGPGRSSGRALRSQVEHRRLFEAIQAANGAAARAAASAHLQAAAARLGLDTRDWNEAQGGEPKP